MTGSSDKSGDGKSGKPADDTSASEGQDHLLNNPAAAMAAATAFGLSVATQMSRFWLGSLQGAMEVTGQLARQLEEERKAGAAARSSEGETEKPVSPPEPQAVAAETVEKPKASKAKVKAPVVKPAPKRAETKPMAEPVETKKDATAPRPAASKTKKAGGQSDDLKRIEGIGPKLEQVLQGRGIRRFADLATLDDAALAALDKDLGLDGRSLRDDWKGQASRLAKGAAKPARGRSGK